MLNRRSFTLSIVLGAVFSPPVRAQSTLSTYIPNHPLYASSLEAMKERQWSELLSSISELPPQSAYTLLRDIGDGSPISDDLTALSRVKGGMSVAGAIRMGWAWRFRGKDVEVKDEKGFARHLFESTDLLTGAIDDDPNDGVAATFLFRALKATGDADALHKLLPVYLAAKRNPVEGLAAYADAISAKWAGSEAEALEFARRYAGSQLAASYGLIPDVHLTTAVARSMSDDAKVAASADSYLRQREVVSEIVAAQEHFLAAKADADPFATLLAHSQFSFGFIEMGDVVRARQHLSAQGDYAGGPWRDIENARSVIAQMRANLGLDPNKSRTAL